MATNGEVTMRGRFTGDIEPRRKIIERMWKTLKKVDGKKQTSSACETLDEYRRRAAHRIGGPIVVAAVPFPGEKGGTG